MQEGPQGLRVGDLCFARGHLLEAKWFKARLLSVRSKRPRLRVEYLATLDGESNPLALPEPRKALVHDADVSANEPQVVVAVTTAVAEDEQAKDAMKGASSAQVGSSDNSAPPDDGEGEPIDEDLMCSVCSRPDDERNMLVCDCKKGYHIYCLSPKLDAIPTGDWRCPECMAE